MKRDATVILYGRNLRRPLGEVALNFLPASERAELEPAREAPKPPEGRVYLVMAGGGPWRCIDVVRATSPQLAHAEAVRRNPDRGPLVVEGPGGSWG